MPTGKVRFYDADKGFGFISEDSGADVFLHANALPEGVTTLKKGGRVEFGIVEGRRAPRRCRSRARPGPVRRRQQDRADPQDARGVVVIIEDVVQLLDSVGNGYCGARCQTRSSPPTSPALARPRRPAGQVS